MQSNANFSAEKYFFTFMYDIYKFSNVITELYSKMSHLVRKPTICICENKGADQLRGNRKADQRLCFRYSDSIIQLLLKSEISSF